MYYTLFSYNEIEEEIASPDILSPMDMWPCVIMSDEEYFMLKRSFELVSERVPARSVRDMLDHPGIFIGSEQAFSEGKYVLRYHPGITEGTQDYIDKRGSVGSVFMEDLAQVFNEISLSLDAGFLPKEDDRRCVSVWRELFQMAVDVTTDAVSRRATSWAD